MGENHHKGMRRTKLAEGNVSEFEIIPGILYPSHFLRSLCSRIGSVEECVREIRVSQPLITVKNRITDAHDEFQLSILRDFKKNQANSIEVAGIPKNKRKPGRMTIHSKLLQSRIPPLCLPTTTTYHLRSHHTPLRQRCRCHLHLPIRTELHTINRQF